MNACFRHYDNQTDGGQPSVPRGNRLSAQLRRPTQSTKLLSGCRQLAWTLPRLVGNPGVLVVWPVICLVRREPPNKHLARAHRMGCDRATRLEELRTSGADRVNRGAAPPSTSKRDRQASAAGSRTAGSIGTARGHLGLPRSTAVSATFPTTQVRFAGTFRCKQRGGAISGVASECVSAATGQASRSCSCYFEGASSKNQIHPSQIA